MESNYRSSERRMLPKVYKKDTGQSETNRKRAQQYKKNNFTMRARWNKIVHIYQTFSAFVDLLSKEMLAWYERTYKDTPNRFSASQFPFLRRTKATKLSTSNLLLSNGSETLALDKIFKKADCVVTFLTGSLPLGDCESWQGIEKGRNV